MRRTRIEFVIDHLNLGGAQRHLVELLSDLDRQRFESQVCVAKAGGSLIPVIEKMGIPVRSFGLGASLARPYSLPQLGRMARRLRKERVDIVHGYLYLGNILGVLAGRLAGTPIRIASKRSLDQYPRRVQLHATRLANHYAHRILCNAEAVRRVVLEVERPAPEKLMVIPNGIRLHPQATAPTKRPASLPTGPWLVGTIGRLSWKKSTGDFLEAARQVRSARRDVDFVIVGDGPLRARMEAEAARLGIRDHVHFLGEVQNAHSLLRSFDVFVLSSIIEGMPNVLLEALAAERPVVVTCAGGMPEIVTNERTGLLVPTSNPEALSAGILRLLEHPEEARRLGQAGRRLVEERFSAEAMCARYTELYETLVTRGTATDPAGAGPAAERPPAPRIVVGQ